MLPGLIFGLKNLATIEVEYAGDADIGTLLHNLESDVASAILWFDANYSIWQKARSQMTPKKCQNDQN